MTTNENSTLFTELTVEQSVTVCGGDSGSNIATAQIFVNPDGSLYVNGGKFALYVNTSGLTTDNVVQKANQLGIDSNTALSIVAQLQAAANTK